MEFDAEKEKRELSERKVDSKEIFDGVILHVFRDSVRLPNGDITGREVIRHVGAVCVIPVTDDGLGYVEWQYRYNC